MNYFIEHVLGPYREMMIKAWGKELVDLIEQEHRALVEVVRGYAPLKHIVDSHSFQTMFNDAWDALPAQPALNHLRLFCGGLASAFANTTCMESDFSILKCEKDAYRTCLMALSLEGVFQIETDGHHRRNAWLTQSGRVIRQNDHKRAFFSKRLICRHRKRLI